MSNGRPLARPQTRRYKENTMAKNTVECPACTDSWPATEADLGLQKCPTCGADLEVTRVPVAWSYELQYVAIES